ncbi:MAG: hypothetical protein R3E91_05335 [Chlamydiales bacterium]
MISHLHSISSQNTLHQPLKMSHRGYLLIALGIIALIGSLVAAGCLYAQLGSLSFSIGGAGMIICILNSVLSKYFCVKTHSKEVEEKSSEDLELPSIAKEVKEKSSEDLEFPFIKDVAIKNDLLNHELLNTPVIKIIDPCESNPSSMRLSRLKGKKTLKNIEIIDQGKKTLKNEEIINIFKDCIKDLDKDLQIQARLSRLNFRWRNQIILKDLLFPWSNSRLRFMLMMDNELNTLPVTILDQFDNQLVWSAIGQRIKHLISKQKPVNLNFNKNGIVDLLLIDLPHLTADNIHIAPKKFPPITFLLININELKKIQTQKLTSEQLELIFSTTDRCNTDYFVQKLTPKQINACAHLITNTKLFANLSKNQIVDFDFSKINKRKKQEVFDILFSTDPGDFVKAQLLARLSVKKIYTLIPYFSNKHWEYISDAQTIDFDFSKINKRKKQEVCNILFSTENDNASKAARLLPKLKKKQISNITNGNYLSNAARGYLVKN